MEFNWLRWPNGSQHSINESIDLNADDYAARKTRNCVISRATAAAGELGMGNCGTSRATRLYGQPLDLVCGKRRLHFCVVFFSCLLVASSLARSAHYPGWPCGHL